MKSLTCVVVGDLVWISMSSRNGDWLSSADPDDQRLKDGETPHGINVTALMNDASKMNPTFRIRNAAFGFPDEADAGEDEIHILVDVPQYVKTVPIMINRNI
ncbi:hypothetical protein PF007_g11470 [Phytophthora fragariae]|uniref:Uncharacterized protein n=1 Tax=Phytophthora fragariae TaxID=53985 RepID=A0A6A3S7T8_9STRA|nr:hypothetical protein PF007_g11470 [Phytophthora fragariae]